SQRLARLVQERGMMNPPAKEQIHQLEAAGADAYLVRSLTKVNSSANLKSAAAGSSVATEIPAYLVQAAADARAQKFHEAEIALRRGLVSDPQNAALH